MNTTDNKLKIRFRLPNGEEFEAEGPQEFIESQRNYFLKLIGNHFAAAQLPPGQFSNTAAIPITLQQPSYYKEESKTVPAANTHGQEIFFWERLFKEDGSLLILRQKVKLTPQDLTLLLLAAARVLLKKQAYSALELSKSFRLCGGAKGRLDRFLTSELQSGRILATGSKRSRTYHLSEEGFARAFVIAEKLLKTT